MSKLTVEVSELRDRNDRKVRDLAKFLEGKVRAKVDVVGGQITVSYEEAERKPPKTYLRVLLRKFLHKAELKEDFRVISGKENVYIIKKRARAEEE